MRTILEIRNDLDKAKDCDKRCRDFLKEAELDKFLKEKVFHLTYEELESLLSSIPKKKYFIATTYAMSKTIEIDATCLTDAIELAYETEFDLTTGEYIYDSFDVDKDYTRELNKKDEKTI